MGNCCISKDARLKDIEKEVDKLFTYEPPPKYTQLKTNKNIKDYNNLPPGYNVSKPNKASVNWIDEHKRPLVVEYVDFEARRPIERNKNKY